MLSYTFSNYVVKFAYIRVEFTTTYAISAY
jgi:hypothetical protein